MYRLKKVLPSIHFLTFRLNSLYQRLFNTLSESSHSYSFRLTVILLNFIRFYIRSFTDTFVSEVSMHPDCTLKVTFQIHQIQSICFKIRTKSGSKLSTGTSLQHFQIDWVSPIQEVLIEYKILTFANDCTLRTQLE